ncbi:hypothetical protein H5410_004581 [Solanum commersonii]|uniref:Uncharacterized protein n=1 Tax=Solanum commersonii TaxID=4109 RepID=A0A9J6B830_SOLCO|nr:hypothetical protein H5410_004581 [Solanum commersonii]
MYVLSKLKYLSQYKNAFFLYKVLLPKIIILLHGYLSFHRPKHKNLQNKKSHVLIVLFPGQGQINQYLQFSKLSINLGIEVTLTTSLSGFNKKRIKIFPFSDDYDEKL